MTIEELKNSIAELPGGGITVKRIKNKESGAVYEYHVYQWRENGKQKSRYLKDDEVQVLSGLIAERKALEAQLTERACENEVLYDGNPRCYLTDIQTGETLRRQLQSVQGLKKRRIIRALENYVFGNDYNRVFILYGLRRTGKTTMIRQVLSEMDAAQFAKAAFIQIHPSDTLGRLNQDLRKLSASGYKYVFIDEVTLMEDFIEGAAVLSDLYAAGGMKVVLSGTDSLGFWISRSNALYDRCRILHTTFIPYHEFETVLGIKGIEPYIQFGGTMSMSGSHYNTFASKESTDEYIDGAIARNIQHSLKCYQDEGHFRHLYALYANNELTSAVNRVVEDINHRFTVSVLTREFQSGDLSLSARNLRKENNVLDLIDRSAVTERLKDLLEIRSRCEQNVKVDEVHVKEIREYLAALDLIRTIPVIDIDDYGPAEERTVFTQAGLRYAQAKALIDALLQDRVFAALSFADRKYVSGRILNEIRGRMLEDIVLLETAVANTDKKVFKLQFSDGEYDMVVFDEENAACAVYEVKYSTIADPVQYRHLVSEEKAAKTEFRFGKICEKYVLYRGETQLIQGIQYLNVEEYLKSLGTAPAAEPLA